ncbi:hypothetical protein [Pantoea sp. BAV 3049]|uniref:hypothetical protein n=1 Tax=Pantoea sp. BAV 3049 TaxID=2654188 RepID=UPI00131D4228|nr:hypothetical protein [Pantoea sp. BAV 3049]
MKEVTTVALTEVTEATNTSQAESEVLIESHPTGIIIPGKVLEAATIVDAYRYLLFVTDDIIFEETLTVLLIELPQGIVEKLVIGGVYASGHFEGLTVSPHSVRFSFIGDTIWTIKVPESPMFKLPFSAPRGVSRPMGLRKYIDISANTFPARADSSR